MWILHALLKTFQQEPLKFAPRENMVTFNLEKEKAGVA